MGQKYCGTCPSCGQKTPAPKQPVILLSSGHDESFAIQGIPAHDVEYGNTKESNWYKLGQEFRTWWDRNVAGGFHDGFVGKPDC